MPEQTQITFTPIGVVRTKVSDEEVKAASEGCEGVVEVFSEYEEGLVGLDGFSHILVVSYFNRLRPDQIGTLKVKPRRFIREGFKPEELPLVGVFSLESPTRPNQIGISLVKLVRRDGRRLTVSGLDLFEGTPVLDIKPYRENYRVEHYEVARWYLELTRKRDGR